MKSEKDQNNSPITQGAPARRPWSKPVLIDLNVSETSTSKARVQANEVAVFSSKAPTEEWGPS